MAAHREREPYRPMESPGVMFFRVTVMLSCLILVPAAAIFGSAFPDLVKTHLVDRIKLVTGFVGDSPKLAEGDRTAAPSTAAAAAWQSAEAAPAWQPAVEPAVHQVEYSVPAVVAEQEQQVPQPPQVVDHFTRIQEQLRQYGATYYALESLENGNGYRFRCAMGIAGNSAVEQFESNHRDPLQAMAAVLSQVEAWRSKVLPGSTVR